jgi:hypothetical protein
MSVYAIREGAHADLVRAAQRARKAMDEGINTNGIWYRITLEDARKMYWDDVRKILREAHVEVDPNSPIAIQCANCKKVSTIARDVKTFRCHCSRHDEQWVLKSRTIEL